MPLTADGVNGMVPIWAERQEPITDAAVIGEYLALDISMTYESPLSAPAENVRTAEAEHGRTRYRILGRTLLFPATEQVARE